MHLLVDDQLVETQESWEQRLVTLLESDAENIDPKVLLLNNIYLQQAGRLWKFDKIKLTTIKNKKNLLVYKLANTILYQRIWFLFLIKKKDPIRNVSGLSNGPALNFSSYFIYELNLWFSRKYINKLHSENLKLTNPPVRGEIHTKLCKLLL